jgi:hypothetical protein
MARLSTLVCTASKAKPPSRSSAPARRASASPCGVSAQSTQPVKRFDKFHSLCPCRIITTCRVPAAAVDAAREAPDEATTRITRPDMILFLFTRTT